jgi:hypothetical protein
MCKHNFNVASAFISGKTTADYTWVLEKLRALTVGIPDPAVIVTDCDCALLQAIYAMYATTANLLCQWHIKQNFTCRCKPFFVSLPITTAGSGPELWVTFLADWRSVMMLLTAPEFNFLWSYMRNTYRQHYFALNYLLHTWLPETTRFVLAWANKSMPLSTVVTLRVESVHAALKSRFKVCPHH